MHFYRIVFSILIFLCGLAPALSADVTYTYRVTDHFGPGAEENRIEKLFIKNNKFKIDQDNQTAQIIDLDQRTIFFLDYTHKEYSSLEFDQIKADLNLKREDVRAQFAQASSEKGELSIQGLDLNDPSNESYHSVKRLGVSENINGRKCEKILIETTQNKITSCAVSEIAGQDEFKRVIELVNLYFGDTAFIQEAISTERILVTQNLFPIKTVTEFSRNNNISGFKEEKQLSDINSGELAASVFEPPKNFRLSAGNSN